MLVITALVGTRDLGQEVYIALTKADTGRGPGRRRLRRLHRDHRRPADQRLGQAAQGGARDLSLSERPWERKTMNRADPAARAASPGLLVGPVEPEPLEGGITNTNFVVRDRGEAISCASATTSRSTACCASTKLPPPSRRGAGISPAVIYSRAGRDGPRADRGQDLRGRGRPATENAGADPAPGPALPSRDAAPSARPSPDFLGVPRRPRLRGEPARRAQSRHLEPASTDCNSAPKRWRRRSARSSCVFGHNDLLAANFIDDGKRLWLIDWDYAGFNSPLFDLGGLASNNELSDGPGRLAAGGLFRGAPPDAEPCCGATRP